MLGERPKPFLFIHIPKTGGTSVENALLPAATGRGSVEEMSREEKTRHGLHGGDRLGPPGQRGEVLSPVIQHESVRYFEKRGLLDGREVVTVVRNPYDRAVSELMYLLRIGEKAREFFCGPTWADDLKRLATFDGLLGHDLGACQVDWLLDGAGDVRADRVMRFERLTEDFDGLCDDWGISVALPHAMNGGRRFPWWSFYDDEALELMGEKYARDFEAFGYDRGWPEDLGDGLGVPSEVWLGSDPGFRLHGRLECPDGACLKIRSEGVWEKLLPGEAAKAAAECRRALAEGGVLEVVTPDLGVLGRLDERPEFLREYLDRNMPSVPIYAGAYAANEMISRCRFVYDEGLLLETLAEGGFSKFRREERFGWLVVRAE